MHDENRGAYGVRELLLPAEVHQAVGMIAARLSLCPTEALTWMRERAAGAGCSLDDLADLILARRLP
jgi:hypothetical protein